MADDGSNDGLITKQSRYPFDETVDELKRCLLSRQITLFAEIDHAGEAVRAGLTMPPTKVLLFGNPKAGTPLMLARPGIAIDLPLKILVAEKADGKVWVSYNDPAFLASRHNLPGELIAVLAAAAGIAASVT